MRRRIVLVGLLCGLALAAGCLGDGGDASQEKQAALDAIDDTTTYRFQTDVSTRATAEGSGPAGGATMTSERNVSGAVDRDARAMELEVTSTRSISGGQTPQQPTESRQRVLIADGTVYVGQLDRNGTLQWLRGERSGISETVWGSQEPLGQIRAVLAASPVTVAGEDTVGGSEATILELGINGTAYQRVVRDELNGSGLAGTSFGRTPAEVRDLSIRLWTADDGTPLRTDVAVEVAVTQQAPQGGAGAPGGGQTIVRRTNATTEFSAHGETIDVEVPSAALNATTIAEQQAARRRALQNRTDAENATGTDGATADGTAP